MDDDDDFFDTISINSIATNNKRHNYRNYLSNKSINTIYYSTYDLNDMELTPLEANLEESSSTTGATATTIIDTQKGFLITKLLTECNLTIVFQTIFIVVIATRSSQFKSMRWRYFTNKPLIVDFVLAYDKENKPCDIQKRQIFEKNLQQVGLILEREENQRIHFVKIHVPRDVLGQYAEILKLRLPIKDDSFQPPKPNIFFATIDRILDCLSVRLDPRKFPERKYRLTAEFSRDKTYLFDVDSPDFFTEGTRITVASYILEREHFGPEDQDKGIKQLLSTGVYKAAYPLHDGDLDENNDSKRRLLFKEWAQVTKWAKYQPIDEIKDYFGVKFALYFAWLGFYTHMLIPAAIIGLLCLLYAATTLQNDYLCDDICNLDIIMCPRCDRFCDYWRLNEGCTYCKIQHFIDNPSTIIFAIFMSFWSILYLELWKRYSAEITHRWGLINFDLQAEPPRPEYLIRLHNAKKRRLNVVTLLQEPSVSYWKVKLPSIILSFTIVLLWILLALSVVFGIVIYRMSLITSSALYGDVSINYRIYIIPITAGIIDLICINLLNFCYDKLARWLTEMELHRTQTEYDDSLSLKIYMFQFVNYYSCIFYIAFLKGKFVGYPAKYNRIFQYRQEECNPGGCLMELTMQLAIIMIGNQAINSLTEILIPLLQKMYNTFKVTTGIEKSLDNHEILISCNQWTEDYKLNDIQSQSLFSEYLEMVLQYGFVTIFVTAFPLAPLFALINNVLEMRLDAKKFIKYYRRPVPQRVKDIGVWLPIMAIIGRISVVSNAFIIAFSSHFIPKLVYMLKISPDGSDFGFLNFTLAYFNTSDFPMDYAPISPSMNVTVCRYSEFRNPPEHELKYKRPLIYWHILAARLAFIVAYQNVVSFVITVVEWIIPDIPRKLNDQIKREAYQTNEMIIKNETERAQIRLRKYKNRDSTISGATIYYDTNGDLQETGATRRNTIYEDVDDNSQ